MKRTVKLPLAWVRFMGLMLGVCIISSALASVVPIPDAVRTVGNASGKMATSRPMRLMHLLPPVPKLQATSYVLMGQKSASIIAERDAHHRLPPASLTKLMSLYVIANALDNGQIKLDDRVRISKKAWQTGGSKMFVEVGKEVPVKLLIQGIIVDSGNDATVAMAEHVAGSEDAFVGLMNQMAHHLGLRDTHYVVSTGLPHPEHYSTAYDIALLARAFIRDYPQYYPWFKQKSLRYNKIKQWNRNRLLQLDSAVDGLKTGHTEAAGYCLAASAQHGEMRLVSVVMGSPSDHARISDSRALLTFGFRFFHSYLLYKQGEIVATPTVWFGRDRQAKLGVAEDFFVTMPRQQHDELTTVVHFAQPYLRAPIVKGQVYGEMIAYLGKHVVAKRDLVSLVTNPPAGWFGRFRDYIMLSVKRWFS